MSSEGPCFAGTDVTIWVQGAIASGIVYGGVTLLAFFCLQLLWRNDGHSKRSPKNRALISYVALMYFLSTLMLASNMNTLFFGVRSWCNVQEVINSLGQLGDVCYVISNWGADALLIWRCMVIYKGCRLPRWTIALLPTILFLGSIGSGIMFLCFPHGSGNILQSRKSGDPENVQAIHSSITLALNIAVTFMIVSRLLLYRHRIVRVLGEKHGSPYTGIIAMIVESQLITVVFGVVLVAELFLEGGLSSGVLLAYQIASQVQIFAPLLIIFRVAQGKAWSSEAHERITAQATVSERGNTLSTLRFGSVIDSRNGPNTVAV